MPSTGRNTDVSQNMEISSGMTSFEIQEVTEVILRLEKIKVDCNEELIQDDWGLCCYIQSY
jgi:hypothetical protein